MHTSLLNNNADMISVREVVGQINCTGKLIIILDSVTELQESFRNTSYLCEINNW